MRGGGGAGKLAMKEAELLEVLEQVWGVGVGVGGGWR